VSSPSRAFLFFILREAKELARERAAKSGISCYRSSWRRDQLPGHGDRL
jgi:hypothetical protein